MAEDRDDVDAPGLAQVRAGRDAYTAGRNLTVNNYVVSEPQPPAEPVRSNPLRMYLEQLAESYRWLELQGVQGIEGVRETGALRIELEKVYIVLKAEPETDYDLRHMASLHGIEVSEAAGGIAVDLIEPTRRESLDAENIRRTYRPHREEAKRAGITDVDTIADAFRTRHRMVLLGGPGSGKTTVGHWLALQLARQTLRQLPYEVAPEQQPEEQPEPQDAAHLHVPFGTAAPFAKRHFVLPEQAGKASAIRIDALPARGKLTVTGMPVAVGQVIGIEQIGRLTYTPVPNECGSHYAHLRFTAGGRTISGVQGTVVMDVGTHVQVPAAQVDPDRTGQAGSEGLVDLGPARVPIFLRLAHYARELAERERRAQPALALQDYLGSDPESCARADGCTAESRNALLRRSLRDGQAVVILDGLDELSETNRHTVLLRIQDFIGEFTIQNALDEARTPCRIGGNQVIVTSRYVGYNAMPVQSGCAHFGVQAMQRPAVEHFARSWSAAVNAQLPANVPGRLSAEALIGEIYDRFRPAVRELATNPLLITILAIVFWLDGHLPDQRAAVYDRVVENLLPVWLNRPECQAHFLLRAELLAALQPMAADLQGNRIGNGLIGLDRISELIEGPLARERGTTPEDPTFRPVLDALLTTIRKQVGLLAEQSPDNYAFFHRTFQEFLAARHLLSDQERAARNIVERLDDPQWREPLLLALGTAMISPEWEEGELRARLLEDVLAGDDPDALLPRSALLVMSALPELENVPRHVLQQMIGRLLHSYALSQDQPQAEGLREGIRDAFVRLRRSSQAGPAAELISELIRQPDEGQDYAGAAAEVLLRIGWFTTETVDALLRVAHRDQARLGWPVRWALLAALGQPAGDPPWSRPAAALDRPRLLAAHLPMRRLLESDPELTAFVQGDAGWLWLLVALYGGLGHTGVLERVREHQYKSLRRLRSAAGESAGPPPAAAPIEFCPGDIVHDLVDSELSRAVQRHLGLREPADSLAETFRRAWEQGTDPESGAEALVGLAALGQDVVALLRDALAEAGRRPAALAALSRFRWLRAMLREPLLRSTETAARTIPDEAPQEHQLDLLGVVIKARAAAGAGPLMVSDAIPAHRYVGATSPDARACLDAEYWAYLFSGLSNSEERRPDAMTGPVTAAEAGRLIRAWSKISRARNHLALPRLPWQQPDLAPRAETDVDHYLAMLDELLTSPPEYDYHAGLLLGRCKPVLTDHPALIWETLAVCGYRDGAFTRGYLVGATGRSVPDSASAALAEELVTMWARARTGEAEPGDLGDVLRRVLFQRAQDQRETGVGAVEAGLLLLFEGGRIADPYLRFRALWRTAVYSRMVPVWLDLNTVVEEITDPLEQARAFEWILMSIPDKKLGLHMSDVLELTRLVTQIADPENRARALCRQAFIVPEQVDELLDAAVQSVEQIADPRRKAESIVEIRSALGGLSSAARQFDALADALPEPWLRDKALGRDSRLVAAYRLRYAAGALAWRLAPEAGKLGTGSHRLRYPTGNLAWGAVYLNAVAAEAGALEVTATGSETDWDLLLGPQPQTGVEALIESAADGGLRVSVREASVLNRSLQAGRAEALRPLWAYLESPDAGAMAMITRWPASGDDAERWKALVQAEAGQLNPDILGRVVELFDAPADRLRLRAALALHGPQPYADNRHRRWDVGRIGLETIEAVAEQAKREGLSTLMSSALGWMQCDTHHDDLDAFRGWLSAAEAGDSRAKWIVEHIESVDEALVTPLLEFLPSAPAGLQKSLLIALAQLAETRKIPAGSEDALCAAIAAVEPAVRQQLSVLPEGPVTCLEAAIEAVAGPDEDARPDAARSLAAESMLWLDDACLTDGATCLESLRRIGNKLYITLGQDQYFEQANAAAAAAAENEDVLRLLLAWARSLTLAEGPDADLGHLMTALEAVARISPIAFAALADPDVWEPILIKLIETADWWVARLAAVRLLGMLRCVTDSVAAALRAAMKDVTFVQHAAYDAVEGFRRMKGDVIPDLLELLADPSTGVAASTARLLTGLARGEGAPDRRRILRGLQDAVTRSREAGPIHLMVRDPDTSAYSVQAVDRLDRVLYGAIFEVSGA